jgi:hypothetical protein
MNYRPTAELRELHDAARCPRDCPLCGQIEAAQDRPVDARDYLIENYAENGDWPR